MAKGFWTGAGSGVVSGLAGLLTGALNYGVSAVNSKRSWKYTQKAMALQDKYNRDFTRDSYGLMREGLSQAGYNPLLAVGSSANSAMYSGSGINSDSDSGSQSVASALDALRLKNESKIADKQTEKLDAEIGKIKAEENDIQNKPHNIIANEVKSFINTGKAPNFDNAKSRVKSLISRKLKAYKLLFDDVVKDVNSAKKAYQKPFELHAVYESMPKGSKFVYRPDLDKLGELPYSLAKYKNKK